MNEEDMECKVIASLMIMLDDKFSNEAKRKAMEDVKKIFEKQQKEIEKRLKEIDSLYKMMSAKDERIEGLTELVNKYNDMQYIRKIEEVYTSKDKIREFIKDITTCRLQTPNEQINMALKERYKIEDEICEMIKEELLGETND